MFITEVRNGCVVLGRLIMKCVFNILIPHVNKWGE